MSEYVVDVTTGTCYRVSDKKKIIPPPTVDDPDYLAYEAWVAAGNNPDYVQTMPVQATKITKLAFRNRFTVAEKIAIEMASLDNPNQPIQLRQVAAAIRVYLKDLDNATYVDMSRADTQEGVQQMVVLGILTQPRATEILTAPIQETELYRG